VLQPNEQGMVEIVMDTARFRGPKTAVMYLTMDNGKTIHTVFRLNADSQDPPQLQ
jgi:hypothetical protein